MERRASFDTLLPQYELAAEELAAANEEAQLAALQMHEAGKRFDTAARTANHLKDQLQRIASEFGLEVPNLSNTSWPAINCSGVKLEGLLLNLVHSSGKYTRKRKPFSNTGRIDSFLGE